MKTKKEVWVRSDGGIYAFNTHCHTLKEAMATYSIITKRKYIAEWWKS